jgi:L-arabinonolactonase
MTSAEDLPATPSTPTATPATAPGATHAAIALASGCTLGEGVLWCERTQRVLFTDIQASRLHAFDPASRTATTWTTPDRVGSLALTTRSPNLLLLALAGGVQLFDLATGTPVGPLLPVEADEPRTRLNDGRCDPQGRFVVGAFNQHDDNDPVGHWWRIDGGDGSLRLEALPLPPVGVANASAFSPDGRRIYFTDSPTRTIWCADYPADGVPGRPEVFAHIAEGDGFPDGACVDSDGGLWVALWDGAAVRRYDADGRITDHLPLPARRPTCPAFGGALLDTLYVTSACVGLAADAGALPLAEGALLALPPASLNGRRGRPEHRFAAGADR